MAKKKINLMVDTGKSYEKMCKENQDGQILFEDMPEIKNEGNSLDYLEN